jgi:hypothetical protein
MLNVTEPTKIPLEPLPEEGLTFGLRHIRAANVLSSNKNSQQYVDRVPDLRCSASGLVEAEDVSCFRTRQPQCEKTNRIRVVSDLQ